MKYKIIDVVLAESDKIYYKQKNHKRIFLKT